MEWLAPIAAGLAFLGMVAVFRLVGGRRRQTALAKGGPVRIPTRLRGAAPYPSRFSRGALEVAATGATRWHARAGGISDLAGAQVLRVRAVVPADRLPGLVDAVVVAQDAAGRVIDIAVSEQDLDLVERVLRDARDAPPARRPSITSAASRQRLPRWPVAVLAVAVALGAAATYLWVAGRRTPAQVLSNDGDGTCQVRWRDQPGGKARDAAVECGEGNGPGDLIDVLVLPWPFSDEAVDLVVTPWIFTIGPLAVGAVGVIGLARSVRRDEWLAPPDVADRPAARPVPVLTAGDLVYSRIAEVAVLRAAAEDSLRRRSVGRRRRWRLRRRSSAAIPGRGVWWRDPTLWRRVRRDTGPVATALVVLVVATAFGAGWWARGWSLRGAAPLHRVDAAVVDVIDPPVWPVPGEVEVRFAAGGRDRVASVATTGDLDVGGQVTIEYAGHDPGTARLVTGDGLPRGILGTAFVAGGACLVLVVRLARALRDLLRLRRLATGPGVPMRYVALAGQFDDVVLALFPVGGDPPPTVLLPLVDDLSRVTRVTGVADVHGEVAADEQVVPVIDGRARWPAERALPADVELVLDVVNGFTSPVDETT